jgi:replication initiation and membrane attachment protein DnaB
MKELYIKTTEDFITRWERDFSIKYDSALTLSQRRQQILNRLATKKTLTWDNLKALIKSNISETAKFYIVNDSANFYFKIMVNTENTSDLQKTIKRAKPAYLTFDIVVTEFFNRYCGTFNCNMSVL